MRGSTSHWLVVAAVPLVGACYVYSPVLTPEPLPGTHVALDLNDQGRAALVTSVGPGATRVEGALVSTSGGEYVMQVSDVRAFYGVRTKWSGEVVGFRQEYVQRIRERRLSRGRTAVAVAGLLGAVVGVAATTGLGGFGNGGNEGRPGGGPGDGQ